MSSEITPILDAIDEGDPRASEELLPLVYGELRRLAQARLASEQPGQSLQATALVHEAYLRLVGSGDRDPATWDGRAHFFAAAARAMRRILVDRARARKTAKRGGSWQRVDMDLTRISLDEVPAELVELDESLDHFREEEPEKAQLVELRFFGGLTLAEAATLLGISTATAGRHWAYARAWLYQNLTRSREKPPEA